MKRTMLALAIALVATQASAAVTVGAANTGNCYPFSCFAGEFGAGAVYQQVYSASAFSGALDFNRISFYKQTGGLLDTASYSVLFSITDKAVGGLGSDLSNNLGAAQQHFGVFSLSGAMPDVLTLTGNTFHYDPTQGNLLMQVTVESVSFDSDYSSFFQADNSGYLASQGNRTNLKRGREAERDRDRK